MLDGQLPGPRIGEQRLSYATFAKRALTQGQPIEERQCLYRAWVPSAEVAVIIWTTSRSKPCLPSKGASAFNSTPPVAKLHSGRTGSATTHACHAIADSYLKTDEALLERILHRCALRYRPCNEAGLGRHASQQSYL